MKWILMALGVGASVGFVTEADRTSDNCDIYVRWYGWAARLNREDSQVRIKGLTWAKIGNPPTNAYDATPLYGPTTVTNGRVWNWKAQLSGKNCDRQRQYRFRIYGPSKLDNGTTNRYAGFERWIYYPSGTTFTTKTDIDVGYLDGCISGAVTCSKPYYPTNQPTQYLDWP